MNDLQLNSGFSSLTCYSTPDLLSLRTAEGGREEGSEASVTPLSSPLFLHSTFSPLTAKGGGVTEPSAAEKAVDLECDLVLKNRIKVLFLYGDKWG
uniref:Uncharacterized protein n=1 Tax=Pyxicephalus adspersus TaxID=30357 RepID=A0AAV3B0P8_PYXAD|nr:TPA: hypothetical protein GDO54_001433 [Pyxicephalus adspersus]